MKYKNLAVALLTVAIPAVFLAGTAGPARAVAARDCQEVQVPVALAGGLAKPSA